MSKAIGTNAPRIYKSLSAPIEVGIYELYFLVESVFYHLCCTVFKLPPFLMVIEPILDNILFFL